MNAISSTPCSCADCYVTLLATDGIELFEQFLKSEFSEENIQFWKACRQYKEEVPPEKLKEEAEAIFEKYISQSAPKLVGIHVAREGGQGLVSLLSHKWDCKPKQKQNQQGLSTAWVVYCLTVFW